VRIIKLAWVGTRTDDAEPTVAFFRDVLGLPLELDRPGFWMLKLPDGTKVEVFGPDTDVNRHFTTGPVAGFLVDDMPAATAELRSAGVEILTTLVLVPEGSRLRSTSPARSPMSGWGADRRGAAVGR
jgi:catechol 2,3-dioxygenase-like lactoylglutathione lyase family enzyme